jgi:protein involved in polysaccharide export with SLBB domain
MDRLFRQCRRRFLRPRPGCALLVLLAAAGCVTPRRAQVADALGHGATAPVNREETVAQSYRIACPDVVELAVARDPASSGRYVVNAEGRIALTALENPRVEGETAAALARRVAAELGLAEADVRCRVVGHESRAVHVHGPVEGGDRAVPYRGTENVVAFLRRCGGLKPSANVRDVHVVRGNLAAGGKPQVFRVDLEGILLRGEAGTNVLLQPFDEVYVGELPRSLLGKAIPHWLGPTYRGFCALFPGACPRDNSRKTNTPEP